MKGLLKPLLHSWGRGATHQLLHADWSNVPAALPLMVVGFTFHSVVPSLLAYLGSAQRVLQVRGKLPLKNESPPKNGVWGARRALLCVSRLR
jgi:hypothetical protein